MSSLGKPSGHRHFVTNVLILLRYLSFAIDNIFSRFSHREESAE